MCDRFLLARNQQFYHRKKLFGVGWFLFLYLHPSHQRIFFHMNSFDIADKFLDILNQEEPKIQFTIEYENEQKEMNFLDVTIKNTGERNFILKSTEKMR